MKMTMWSAVILGVAVLCMPQGGGAQSAEPEQAGPYGSLVIRDVTVIDGSGAPAFGPADVFVKGNRIVRVVPSDAISREESKAEAAHEAKPAAPDRVIDGKGMYLTPGLIDVHAHINETKDVPAEYIYKLYLGHGVTTVRTFNVGNDSPKEMVEEKKKIAANQIMAPRMYVYPFWRESDPRSSTVEGANQIVDEWHAWAWTGSRFWGSRDCGRIFFRRSRRARGNTTWAWRCTSGRTACIR